MNAPLHAAFF